MLETSQRKGLDLSVLTCRSDEAGTYSWVDVQLLEHN